MFFGLCEAAFHGSKMPRRRKTAKNGTFVEKAVQRV